MVSLKYILFDSKTFIMMKKCGIKLSQQTNHSSVGKIQVTFPQSHIKKLKEKERHPHYIRHYSVLNRVTEISWRKSD